MALIPVLILLTVWLFTKPELSAPAQVVLAAFLYCGVIFVIKKIFFPNL